MRLTWDGDKRKWSPLAIKYRFTFHAQKGSHGLPAWLHTYTWGKGRGEGRVRPARRARESQRLWEVRPSSHPEPPRLGRKRWRQLCCQPKIHASPPGPQQSQGWARVMNYTTPRGCRVPAPAGTLSHIQKLPLAWGCTEQAGREKCSRAGEASGRRHQVSNSSHRTVMGSSLPLRWPRNWTTVLCVGERASEHVEGPSKSG